MATYVFETITPAQALAIQSTDVVLATSKVPGAAYTVRYDAGLSTISVIQGATTVAFSATVMALSQAGGFRLPDGSVLYIGGETNDSNSGPTRGTAAGDGLYGGQGDDILDGFAGRDLLQGNQGNDVLYGSRDDDTLYGGQGDDILSVGSNGGAEDLEAGANLAQGNRGNDTIYGGYFADTLLGGQDNDLIRGGGGDDLLYNTAGADTLDGGAGADSLISGAGRDVLTGGAGADYFRPGWLDAQGLSAFDVITDLETGVDRIDVGGLGGRYVESTAPHFDAAEAFALAQMAAGASVVVVQIGQDVAAFIDNGGGASAYESGVVLTNRSLSDVAPADFLF